MLNTTVATIEMMVYRQPAGPKCPLCRTDMVLSRIGYKEMWYCPKCGFVGIEGGDLYE
jgi:ribosomal protein L37AE/L43A